jgi:hypothetical protein
MRKKIAGRTFSTPEEAGVTRPPEAEIAHVRMKFDDTYFSREDRYSHGVECTSGQNYASIPVSNGIVDYEEYYAITPDQFDEFVASRDAALQFVESCRREQDDLLIQKPGSNRGTPV